MDKTGEPGSPSFLRGALLRWAFLFAVIFPLSFPFERNGILPDPGLYTQFFFEWLARFTGNYVFGLDPPHTYDLVSDTTGFYLNAFNLLVLTSVAAFTWTFFRQQRNESKLIFLLHTWIRYYLALQMLWYGFDKIFKVQFYLPEPNTLFTTVGHTQRDLLYWTVMGTSYTYTFFSGLVEILAAVLLLFNRTALLGILFTAGIMTNVLMINIGFDISVKLYSAFLLLLCSIIILIHARSLYRFFILQVPSALNTWRPKTDRKIIYVLSKSIVIFLILADVLMPFVRAGNYNDDLYPRPMFHGAYQVNECRLNDKTLAPDLRNGQRWKRFFVHRRGYFIVQYMNDEMRDLELQYHSAAHELVLKDYNTKVYTLHYKNEKNLLKLEGVIFKDTIEIVGEKIPLESLPLLQKEFSWTIDE